MNDDFITYLAGGRLGDFILSLSVIKENYNNKNKKGLLYISDNYKKKGGDFSNGVENTYKELYEIIIKQEYIIDFKIYNNEIYDVNLSSWRDIYSPGNFHNIYSSTFGIDWGKTPWIICEKDEKWKNVILINTVTYRPSDFNQLTNFYNIKTLYPNHKLVFISNRMCDYEIFKKIISIDCEYFCPKDLYETFVAINSCYLFIGSPSAYLSIGFTLHKKTVSVINDNAGGYLHVELNDIVNTSYDI